MKYLEDKMNVDNDTKAVGVQSIIVIEDSIRSYSSFLPIIYTEVIKHSQRLISEGINLSHKYLRMRARPKILLCSNYEEAMYYFDKYNENILGILSDVNFYMDGVSNPKAGIEFAKSVRSKYSDIPILLQSSNQEIMSEVNKMGFSFLIKDSPTFLHDLQQFIVQNFSFGDFIFKTPDGKEVGRATDLHSMEALLETMPLESIKYHGEKNHFSNWLKARTEFWIADQLRYKKVSDYSSIEEIRKYLITALKQYQKSRQRGIITDFNKDTFDPDNSFARIGGGSLGGKARGLSFLNIIINNFGISNKYEGIEIDVPPAIVIGTDVFDCFLEENDLKNFALNSLDDEEIKNRFLEAKYFPEDTVNQLVSFLELVRVPLSVRSSSLLEDSQYLPFAGVYETYMIPNNHSDQVFRINDLISAIKLVYASTFSNNAKDYFKMTTYRLEEEKMAVIIQKMVGSSHKFRFYPDFSGVAKTYNFYPIPPMKPTDGVASVALGLGKTIVEGGTCMRFCPKYPTNLIQFSDPKQILDNIQKSFYALDLDSEAQGYTGYFSSPDDFVKKYDVGDAEKDGTLDAIGSTYDHNNNAVYDGLSRDGMRLVTFAPILKYKYFPLAEIVDMLINMGSLGMGSPVEIEFAVNLSVPKGKPKEFGVLQMRPLVVNQDTIDIHLDKIQIENILCNSNEILGNGITTDIYDIVFVDINKFERASSRETASEVSYFNNKLVAENKKYILIGVGRWGTLDPWLGIPVSWSQISGATAIIEAGMKDIVVEPSQGSHFFQNLTSFNINYFTVNYNNPDSHIDWDWLLSIPPFEEKKFVKHLRFEEPLSVLMNAHEKVGVILKSGKILQNSIEN